MYIIAGVAVCRYMMYMYIRAKGEVFLLDRDDCVFACAALIFPANTAGDHLSDTLLDGVSLL